MSEQGCEGCSELSLCPTTGHARAGDGVKEVSLDNDMDPLGEIQCVGALRKFPGLSGAIEKCLDGGDCLLDELALVGADEGVAGRCRSEGNPDDRFFATRVIVRQQQEEPGDEGRGDRRPSGRCHSADLLTVSGSQQRRQDELRPGRKVVLNRPDRDTGLGRHATDAQRVEPVSCGHGDGAVDDPVTHDAPQSCL